MRETIIIAHRGASHDAPENTLAAFRLAFEQDADAIELDVHLSCDGEIIVIHDADTQRVSGVKAAIAEQTLDELRKLNVAVHGKWRTHARREGIPTLAQALALVPGGKRVFIEIKCRCEAIEKLAADLARSGLAPSQATIITFQYDVAVAAKRRLPSLKVLLLCGCYKKQSGELTTIAELIQKARDANLDGLDLDQSSPIDAAAVQQIKSAGLFCYIWTVDNVERAQALVRAGVNGITTNRPGALRRELLAASAAD